MEPVYIDIKLRQDVDKEAEKATQAIDKLESESLEASRKAEQELRESIALQKQHLARLKADIAKMKMEMQSSGDWSASLLKEPLEKLQAELIDELEGLRHLKAELEMTRHAKETLARKIYQVKDAMAKLRLEGNESSQAYSDLSEQLETLNDAYQEVNKEQQMMTKGAGQLEGIIGGLQAVSGAVASVVGAIGLVNGESEKYQRIQTKVQSLLAITIGLQQVHQAVSATSAFRMKTLTAVTALYTRAVKWLSVALKISEVNAKRMMSALTMGLSIVITWAVTALDKFVTKQKEAKEAQKAFQEAVSSSASQQIAKFEELRHAYQALEGDEQKKQEFVEKHKQAFDELGVSITNANEADNLFVSNADAFKESLKERAKAMATFDLAVEQYKLAIQKEMEAKERANKPTLWDSYLSAHANQGGVYVSAQEIAQDASKDLQQEADKIRAEGDKLIDTAQGYKEKAKSFLDKAGINEKQDSKPTTPTDTDTAEEEARRKREANYKKWLSERKRAYETLAKYSRDAEKEATAIEIASIKNARERKLRELENEYNQRKALIASRLKEIAQLEAKYHIDGSKERGNLNALSQALDTQYQEQIEAQKEASQAILRELDAEVSSRQSSRLQEQLQAIDTYYQQVEEKARENATSEEELQALLTKAHTMHLREREVATKESELRRLELEESVALRLLQMQQGNFALQADAEEEFLKKKLEFVRKRLETLQQIEANGGEASEAIQDATLEIEELSRALEEIPTKRISEIGKGLQGIFSSLASIGGELGEVFSSASSAIGNILSSLKSGASTMDLLGNAVSGIMQVVGMVAEQNRINAEEEKKYAEAVEASYHRLALARINAYRASDDNIFGVENPYKRAIAGAKRYRQAMLELHNMMERLSNGRVQTGTKQVVSGKNIAKGALGGAAAGAALGSIIPGLGTLLGGAIGALFGAFAGAVSTKTVPVFKSLASQYGSILKEGSKTFELNPKILADYDKLDEATKKLVDNWEAIRKEALEAQKEMRETFQKLSGDIGDLLGKALADAFRTGEWESEMANFEKKLDEMIGRILDQLIFSAVFGEEFRKLQKAMEDSFGVGGDQSIVDDIIAFKKIYRKLVEEYKKAKKEAQEEMGNEGIDIWSEDSERDAVARKGLAQASQDSINELMGIATNQLLQLRTLVELQRKPNPNDSYRSLVLGSIARHVATIATHTQHLERLEALATDLASIKRDGITIAN